MKYTIALIFVAMCLSPTSYAKELQDCGMNEIDQVITGLRHGALLNLSNNQCGNAGYVCLDIEGYAGSKEKGNAAYAFALAMYLSKQKVQVTVDLDVNPPSCGGYPVVEDLRN